MSKVDEQQHTLYSKFRSYFKGGNNASIAVRFRLMDAFANGRRDASIDTAVQDVIESGDRDQLIALGELLKLLSEARQGYLVNLRLLQLALDEQGLVGICNAKRAQWSAQASTCGDGW